MTSEKKKIYPPVYFLAGLLLVAAAHYVLPVRTLVGSPLSLAGLAPIAAGIGIAGWSNALFRRADTTIKPFEESSSLVTHGPFGYSRNPMYLGMVLVLAGAAWMFGTLTSFLVVPVFAVVIQILFIRAEESMLAATFGDEYEDYRRRVRRWI